MTEARGHVQLLGITLAQRDGRIRATMRFSADLVGRPNPPRLHGGAIAGLLETIGLATVRSALPGARLGVLSTSVDFLRSGRPQDCHAEAEVLKLGKRVVNIVATAWQKDRDKPIARASISILVAPD